MTFKKIVGFGDSWMYGDELLDPKIAHLPDAHTCWEQNTPYRERNCFLGRLGQHYQVLVENFGIAGGSLQSTIWTFLWWLNHEPVPEDCLILVGLTNADRISHYNPNHIQYSNDPPWNKFVHSSWVNFGSSSVPDDFSQMIKTQMVLTSSMELNRFNYQQAVLMLDGIAARRNFKLLQFHIMPGTMPLTHVPTLIDPKQCFVNWFWNHPDNKNRGLIKPNGHPNEHGHEMIKHYLISQIEECII